MSNSVRSISELSADLQNAVTELREHFNQLMHGENPGLTDKEVATMRGSLHRTERGILEAAIGLHEVQAVLLSASMRWIHREMESKDPNEEETVN